MSIDQRNAAKEAMINWLSHPNELGKAPTKIECAKEFDLYDMHYYVFKFKAKLLGDWLLAVCGGYEGEELEHCGHIFSKMEKYNDATAVQDATKIVEEIRAYWMNRAKEQEDFQAKFKANTEFRSQEVINADDIKSQFVKTESRFFLNIGEIDCPTGNIVVSDPLAYLPSAQFSPMLAKKIPCGKYPVFVSICRQDDIGVRMCTAKLKVKDTEVVKYERATATQETVIKLKDDKTMEGFPVDAGVMSFCDAEIANEYIEFIDKWYQENPNGNHYDDYFAEYFAESYNNQPAYQREGGDFIEWTNPDTGKRLVMIASGLGDGFYQTYYGYDKDGDISEIIVPLLNPEIFSA